MPQADPFRYHADVSYPEQIEYAWAGAVTAGDRAQLREVLFSLLERTSTRILLLDVRQVTSVDRNAIASLIAANHFATATARQLVIVDSNGPVTQRLVMGRIADDFRIVQHLPRERATESMRFAGTPEPSL